MICWLIFQISIVNIFFFLIMQIVGGPPNRAGQCDQIMELFFKVQNLEVQILAYSSRQRRLTLISFALEVFFDWIKWTGSESVGLCSRRCPLVSGLYWNKTFLLKGAILKVDWDRPKLSNAGALQIGLISLISRVHEKSHFYKNGFL